jgi:glutamate dehydrogenase (NAD(P)+)
MQSSLENKKDDKTTNIVYTDPEFGHRGFLSLSGNRHRLSAGGLRVQKGLTAETIEKLSQLMLYKQQLIGLSVNGAKCGINFEPHSPNKTAALKNFLRFLKPYINDGLSVGGDLNTHFSELEQLAAEVGITSIKNSIAKAQQISNEEYLKRMQLLEVNKGGLTLGQRRAGHATAHAVLSVMQHAGLSKKRVKIGLQGFGTMGRATALSLWEEGVKINAVADKSACLLNNKGFQTPGLLALPVRDELNHSVSANDQLLSPQALFQQDLDILILAAIENAIPEEIAATLKTKAVVVASNIGLSEASEKALEERNITVVPDFVGGCGGSASMEALFGPAYCPDADKFLKNIAFIMNSIMDTLFDKQVRQNCTFKEAAIELCKENASSSPTAPTKPYGKWNL